MNTGKKFFFFKNWILVRKKKDKGNREREK